MWRSQSAIVEQCLIKAHGEAGNPAGVCVCVCRETRGWGIDKWRLWLGDDLG